MRKLFLLLAVAITFSSCATLFTGTKDTIKFDSTPQGATIYIDGIELCKTPCSYPVKRDLNAPQIEYKLDGYQARVFTLNQEFNVVSVLNLGNVIGWAIDAVTGAIMKYDMKSYNLELDMDTRALLANPNEIHINTEEMVVDVYVTQ